MIQDLIKQAYLDGYAKGEKCGWVKPQSAKESMASDYAESKLKILGIADVSGLACKCGNQIFTHRHSNWIECTACNKIQVLQA